jgi:hypothetical protein
MLFFEAIMGKGNYDGSSRSFYKMKQGSREAGGQHGDESWTH